MSSKLYELKKCTSFHGHIKRSFTCPRIRPGQNGTTVKVLIVENTKFQQGQENLIFGKNIHQVTNAILTEVQIFQSGQVVRKIYVSDSYYLFF